MAIWSAVAERKRGFASFRGGTAFGWRSPSRSRTAAPAAAFARRYKSCVAARPSLCHRTPKGEPRESRLRCVLGTDEIGQRNDIIPATFNP
jgi:hypothetical protein